MANKTAMQELIEFLIPELKMQDFQQLPAYEKANQLLEKEKQQIVEAYKQGRDYFNEPPKSADQYYTETYETN